MIRLNKLIVAESNEFGETQLDLESPQQVLGRFLRKGEKMVNKTTELHQLRVAVEQPNQNSTYAEKLKYLVKVVDPNFPSYDFILRLASFATCSKLSPEQQKKADEFITYFVKQGYFNQILYLNDEPTYQMLYDFCKKHNLKRIKIERFIDDMYDMNWGFDPYEANGLKDWKKAIIEKNKEIVISGIRSIKGLKTPEEEKLKNTIIKSMLTGDIMEGGKNELD